MGEAELKQMIMLALFAMALKLLTGKSLKDWLGEGSSDALEELEEELKKTRVELEEARIRIETNKMELRYMKRADEDTAGRISEIEREILIQRVVDKLEKEKQSEVIPKADAR